MTSNKIYQYWVPVFLWVIFIFWMSTDKFSPQNTSSIVEPIFHFLMPKSSEQTLSMSHMFFRKIAHLIEYFVLGFLLFRAFRGDSKELRIQQWTSSMIVLMLCAASDEFHQYFVSARTASSVDMLIDLTGGTLALVFRSLLLLRGRKLIKSNWMTHKK
jgi:VanZ family protein